MAALNFSLPDDLKRWIESQVESGGYGNTSEYIRELVRMDRKKKSEERLETLLLQGLESLETGKGIEIDPAFWERKRQELVRKHRTRAPRKKKSA